MLLKEVVKFWNNWLFPLQKDGYILTMDEGLFLHVPHLSGISQYIESIKCLSWSAYQKLEVHRCHFGNSFIFVYVFCIQTKDTLMKCNCTKQFPIIQKLRLWTADEFQNVQFLDLWPWYLTSVSLNFLINWRGITVMSDKLLKNLNMYFMGSSWGDKFYVVTWLGFKYT